MSNLKLKILFARNIDKPFYTSSAST